MFFAESFDVSIDRHIRPPVRMSNGPIAAQKFDSVTLNRGISGPVRHHGAILPVLFH